MRKEIKYIGFYDLPNAKGSRVSTLAAINKMDYIAEAINRAGFDVHIVSPAWSSDNGSRSTAQKGETIHIHPNKKVTFCPTYSTENKITRNLKIIFTLIWLFLWLIKNVKRNEKIIVYHVQWLSLPLRLAKRLKGFNLILEVEEFYGNVWKNKNILNKWEQKLIKSADSYIAVSDVLAELLGEKVKAVVYGSYLVPDFNNTNPYFLNDKINVVYAGSIDDTKGGAFNAAKCAELLPVNYIVHILGSGNIQIKNELLKQIDLINIKLERSACIYHGVLNGKNYDEFLFNCQIAINPQKEGKYMNTAFPSKVISYLSHNLRVVSTRINSIEKSKLRYLITFSEDDQPINIVQSILSIDFNNLYDSASEIKKLNDDFVINLMTIGFCTQ
ncbi:MAG: glycosyltransferase [Paludibacter sp.]|nr:glycosyltransferase [Paludibacter sp.]